MYQCPLFRFVILDIIQCILKNKNEWLLISKQMSVIQLFVAGKNVGKKITNTPKNQISSRVGAKETQEKKKDNALIARINQVHEDTAPCSRAEIILAQAQQRKHAILRLIQYATSPYRPLPFLPFLTQLSCCIFNRILSFLLLLFLQPPPSPSLSLPRATAAKSFMYMLDFIFLRDELFMWIFDPLHHHHRQSNHAMSTRFFSPVALPSCMSLFSIIFFLGMLPLPSLLPFSLSLFFSLSLSFMLSPSKLSSMASFS